MNCRLHTVCPPVRWEVTDRARALVSAFYEITKHPVDEHAMACLFAFDLQHPDRTARVVAQYAHNEMRKNRTAPGDQDSQ